jgi:Ca2+-binding RTX toxin-like protein
VPPPGGRPTALPIGTLTLSVTIPPGFRVARVNAHSFLRCQTTPTTVTCPSLPPRLAQSVEIVGTADGRYFDRAGELPKTLSFNATVSSSDLIDNDPGDNTRTAELRLKDGVCGVDLTDRGNGRRNRVRGTIFGDRMAGAAGADRLNARSGRDCVRGGNGDDTLIGGPGGDRLGGGNGDDRIAARDGARDRVACGPGDDLAVVDGKDRVSGCEKVRRP